MSTARSTEAGFTMIEVMISVLITAIAALGFIAMYMTETQAGAFTRHSTEASILATDKLEVLRGLEVVASGNDTVNAQGNAAGMYTRKWTVTPVTDATGNTLYMNVLVQVGWNEDETGSSCSTDTACRSRFCTPLGTCAGRAVIVRGSRN